MGIILVPLDIKYDYHIFPFRVILAESDCNPSFYLKFETLYFIFENEPGFCIQALKSICIWLKYRILPNHYVLFAVKGQISVFCLSHWNRYVSISNLHESVISSSKLPSSKTFLIYSSQLGVEGVQIFQYHFISLSLLSGHCRCYGNSCSCCHQSFLLFLLSSPRFLMFFSIVVVIRWHYTWTYLMVLPFFESDMFAKEIR